MTRSTSDGKPPHPEYSGADSPAPQPVDPRTGQHRAYWVLSEEDRAKGFVRPLRSTYWHDQCETKTTMGAAIAETYARDPSFYDHTLCARCIEHAPLKEFRWVGEDGSVTDEIVGS